MLLAACLVSAVVGMVAGVTSEPQRCCFDREYSADLGEAGGYSYNGKAYVIDGSARIGYDFYKMRVGTIVTMREQNSSVYTTTYTLKDYGTRMEYTTKENGTCHSTHLDDSDVLLPPCVPDDARFVGSNVFGYGKESLRTNTWEYRLPNSDITYKMALTEACVPVIQTLYGHMEGVLTELSLFYTAYHPGIAIANINDLNPPDNCTFVPPASQNGRLPPGRRSFL